MGTLEGIEGEEGMSILVCPPHTSLVGIADPSAEQSTYIDGPSDISSLTDSTRSYRNISYCAHWLISPKPSHQPHRN